jgi:uncharacterized protein YggE
MEITNTNTNEKSKLIKAAAILFIIISVYFLVQIVSSIKEYRFIGSSSTATKTISFEGKGEVFAAPDIATISFTIREESKEMKDAQTKVTTKETAVLSFLDKSGIAKKDIKAENYSSYPKYDYGTPCYSYMMPCRQDSPKITGYEVSEYISVKIRDLGQAGDIVKGVGAVGVSEMSGPNFSVEKEESLKAQARKMAIDEAKSKAESLAKDLGVTLVRIVDFSEGGNYAIYNYASKDMMTAGAAPESAPAPALPTGENKITSNVTVTYEIR